MERQDYEEGIDEEVENEEEEYSQEEEEQESPDTDSEEEAPSPHEHPEEEDEDSEEEEPEPEVPVKRPKTRPNGHARIQQVTREKFQALNELQRMRQEYDVLQRETEALRNKAQSFGGLALKHYDDSANLRREQAIAKKHKALEEGDIQAQLDADVEIASTTLEIQKINEWKTEEAFKEKRAKELYEQQQQMQQSQPYSQPAQQFDEQASMEWQARNSWYFPQSPDFDPDLKEAADNYAAQIENHLFRINRPDIIGTKEFLNEISTYVQSIRQANTQGESMANRKQVSMRPVKGGVSPVRNVASHQATRRKEGPKLSSQEKEIANIFGIKESDYHKQKLKELSDPETKWRYGR